MATFKVTFDELGATGEDAAVDTYRALRDLSQRMSAGMFKPSGPVPDFIRALAASAKGLERIEVKANGLTREECITIRGILDAAARRAGLEDLSRPEVAPLRALALAWERFADVRTNDPRSLEEKRRALQTERGWITY